MISKRIATACLLAAIAVSPAQRVAAGGGDALVGGLVGGIIGGVIVNEANKNKRRTTTHTTTYSSASRAENREVQVALNYFGFPVGTPDGVLGRHSRAAVADYQAFLGYSPTGQLSPFEQNLLVTSYHRGVAGGALTMQQAAANPMGMRGLLMSYRDEMMGMPAQPGIGSGGDLMASAPEPANPFAAPAANQPLAVAEPSPAPMAPMAPVAAAPEPAPAQSALPSFMGGAATQASLASHCNRVSVLTNSNGGYTTAATMSDPNFALNEQFCLARSYAISEGEDLAAKVQGFTASQIADQCNGFGPAMKDEISALSLKPRDEVMQQVSSFVLTTGMAPAQLEATARICLSVGYRTDNMDVAIGSALLLASLGDRVYSELLGHHLAEGFGAAKRPDLALAWYQQALDALGSGTEAAFVPGQPDRADLIRKAAYMVAGKPQAEAAPASKLPSFGAPVTQQAAAAPAPAAPAASTSLPPPPLPPPSCRPPARRRPAGARPPTRCRWSPGCRSWCSSTECPARGRARRTASGRAPGVRMKGHIPSSSRKNPGGPGAEPPARTAPARPRGRSGPQARRAAKNPLHNPGPLR